MNHPTPTGAYHEVAPDEMFFSTTDSKGVITEANQVFVSLARLSREELIGAAHNIIRHPDMPAGASQLMWDELQAGRPFCAYVDNLAGDGSRYTVFATITPLDDGYLSVRVRPGREDLLETARSLYRQVRPHELELRDKGLSAHEAALVGLGDLAGLLTSSGLTGYEDFELDALPAEVAKRDATHGAFPHRDGAEGALATALAASSAFHRSLLTWIAHLDELTGLARTLTTERDRLTGMVRSSSEMAHEFTQVVESQATFIPILGMVQLWAAMTDEISANLAGTAQAIAELRLSSLRTRFAIALCALQSECLGQFLCELIDGTPGADAARGAITQLVKSLQQGVANAQRTMETNVQLAHRVSADVAQLADLLGMPTSMLSGWQAMVAGSDAEVVQELMPQVSSSIEQGELVAERLRGLAERCERVHVLDGDLSEQLGALTRLAREVSLGA